MGVSGQDPNIALPPNVTAQELDAAVKKGVEAMQRAGYTVTMFLPPIMEGITALESELQQKKYDLVLITVGISTYSIRRVYSRKCMCLKLAC